MLMNNVITIKTPSEMEKMKEAGKRLALVEKELKNKVKEGVNAAEIEELACALI